MSVHPIDIPAPTLADLLTAHLDVAFVGINPSCFSVERGHYFARPTNRFWPCLSRSVLSLRAREALRVAQLGPQHDRALLVHRIGFTDVVKRATPMASDLAPGELAAGVGDLPGPYRLRHGGAPRASSHLPWTDSALSRAEPERCQRPLHTERPNDVVRSARGLPRQADREKRLGACRALPDTRRQDGCRRIH
jgi:hypothetical protein